MDVLKTEALTKVYGKGQNKVTALDKAEISISEGSFVAIVGTSGSGKSTLLHMMGGLDRPSSARFMLKTRIYFH